jgi:hypothetical protein
METNVSFRTEMPIETSSAAACPVPWLHVRPQAVYNQLNMASNNPVNNLRRFTGKEVLEESVVHSRPVVRDPDGVWRYTDTWIPVPGARDVTLTERFEPKFVISQENEIERVVVSGESIAVAPELLDWCLEAGTSIQKDGDLVEVFVPFELWAEHDRVPGELIAPEQDGDKAEQDLATVEREYREAEANFDVLSAMRAHILRRHAEKLTRQRAREITGLSVGRIQQLIRANVLDEEEFRLLELFEESIIPTFDELQDLAADAGLAHTGEVLGPALQELQNRGFLEEVPAGMMITPAGQEALFETREAQGEAEAEED